MRHGTVSFYFCRARPSLRQHTASTLLSKVQAHTVRPGNATSLPNCVPSFQNY